MELDEAQLRDSARVEMLPLIDVVFLLLVFFIFVMLSMALHKGLPVNLPEATQSKPITTESVQISITENGTIAVNSQEVTYNNLITSVKQAQRTASDPIIIQGDKMSNLEHALRVLENLSAAGIHNIAFATVSPTVHEQH